MSGHPAPPSTGADDHALITAHVQGDPDAFATLVSRHKDRLWNVAMRLLRNPDDAADAVQDALISALRSAEGFRGDAAVSTWLHRIVVNACLDRLRRQAARPTVALGDYDPAGEGDPQQQVVARLTVRAGLATLPSEQREALILVDLEDRPVAEVAALLGVPVGTVKSRCSRGRVALAAFLRGQNENAASHGNRGGMPHVASEGGSPKGPPPALIQDW